MYTKKKSISLNVTLFRANFGIFCSTPGIAVGRCVPKKIAAHMLLTGLSLNAEEAYQAGLVSKVVTPENLGMFFDLLIGKND